MSPSPRLAPEYQGRRSLRHMAALAACNANRRTDAQFGLLVFLPALAFLLVVFS
jgi:hypothetical protein